MLNCFTEKIPETIAEKLESGNFTSDLNSYQVFKVLRNIPFLISLEQVCRKTVEIAMEILGDHENESRQPVTSQMED